MLYSIKQNYYEKENYWLCTVCVNAYRTGHHQLCAKAQYAATASGSTTAPVTK